MLGLFDLEKKRLATPKRAQMARNRHIWSPCLKLKKTLMLVGFQVGSSLVVRTGISRIIRNRPSLKKTGLAGKNRQEMLR